MGEWFPHASLEAMKTFCSKLNNRLGAVSGLYKGSTSFQPNIKDVCSLALSWRKTTRFVLANFGSFQSISISNEPITDNIHRDLVFGLFGGAHNIGSLDSPTKQAVISNLATVWSASQDFDYNRFCILLSQVSHFSSSATIGLGNRSSLLRLNRDSLMKIQSCNFFCVSSCRSRTSSFLVYSRFRKWSKVLV